MKVVVSPLVTTIPPHVAKRMCAWVARQMKMRRDELRLVTIRPSRVYRRGTAFPWRREIFIYHNLISSQMIDTIAHEMAHIRCYVRRDSGGGHHDKRSGGERYVRAIAAVVVRKFDEHSAELLAAWREEPKARPKKERAPIQERRADHAIAMLRKAETRSKRAKTIEKKWRDKVRYYGRVKAAKGKA